MEENHCRTNTSVKKNKSIQKNRTVRITVTDPSRKVNHLSKVRMMDVMMDVKVRMMDVKVSKDKHISRYVDRENLIYVR